MYVFKPNDNLSNFQVISKFKEYKYSCHFKFFEFYHKQIFYASLPTSLKLPHNSF